MQFLSIQDYYIKHRHLHPIVDFHSKYVSDSAANFEL